MTSYQLVRNFETKDQLRLAVHNNESVTIDCSPCPDGTYTVSGPHGDPPHQWYSVVTVENGVITKVIS
jgi:hypothetical protein